MIWNCCFVSYPADSECVKRFNSAAAPDVQTAEFCRKDMKPHSRGCASTADIESPLCASALNACSARSLAGATLAMLATPPSALNRDTEKYFNPQKIEKPRDFSRSFRIPAWHSRISPAPGLSEKYSIQRDQDSRPDDRRQQP